jgi:adenine/guanine phosphoribosyltransferase-like PRPP-binding protein
VAGCAFVIELAFLGGRRQLEGYDVHSLISYRSE